MLDQEPLGQCPPIASPRSPHLSHEHYTYVMLGEVCCYPHGWHTYPPTKRRNTFSPLDEPQELRSLCLSGIRCHLKMMGFSKQPQDIGSLSLPTQGKEPQWFGKPRRWTRSSRSQPLILRWLHQWCHEGSTTQANETFVQWEKSESLFLVQNKDESPNWIMVKTCWRWFTLLRVQDLRYWISGLYSWVPSSSITPHEPSRFWTLRLWA